MPARPRSPPYPGRVDLGTVDVDTFFTTPVTWWEALLAVLAVIAGWIASRFAKKGMVALLRRVPSLSPGLIVFAARFTQYVILLFGIGLALAVLGANVQPLLAMVLIIGLVVVLVLRGVADNFAAGVLIQTRQSVRIGEEVVVEGPDGDPIAGTVAELNSRAVILNTVDGRTVHVPNAQLLTNTLVNHSRHGARRSDVQVRVAMPEGTDPDAVMDRVARAAEGVAGVLDDEAVRPLAVSLSEARAVIRLQFWHDPLQGAAVTSAVVRAVAAAIVEAGWKGTVTSTPGAPPYVPSDEV